MCAASSSERRFIAVVLATLVLATGCATQLTTGSCSKPTVLWASGTNIVMAPPSGDAGTGTLQQLGRIGGLIQTAAVAIGSDFEGVKIVRLVPEKLDDPSCRPEAIRYTWSGCGRGAVLIPSEPVTVVWPSAHQAGEETYVQFAISNWIVDGSYDLTVNIRTPSGRKYALATSIPIEDVTFLPRRIAKERIEEMSQAFGCDLYSQPSRNGGKKRLENCASDFDGKVLGRKTQEGETFFYVMLKNGTFGWMPAPSVETVKRIFPEFGLLGVAVAYQQFVKDFGINSGVVQHRNIADAFKDFREAGVTSENGAAAGVAEVIMGSADLMQGLRYANDSQLQAASSHFAEATRLLPYQSEAANLQTIAEILRCCTGQILRVTPREIEIVMTTKQNEVLEAQAMKVRAYLMRDPASTPTLRNLDTLLRMMRDRGQATIDGQPVAAAIEGLAPVLAARVGSERDLSCESLYGKATAQLK